MTPSTVVVSLTILVARQLVTQVLAGIPLHLVPAPEPAPEPVPEPACDICKVNEVFSKCDNHGCQNTCTEPDLITRCHYIPGCYPGCICKPGFLRDPSGKCIRETLCKCRKNEQYSNLGKTICASTCEDPRKSTKCKAKAVPGCGCKEGYLRNKKGYCVLPEDCGGCGGDPNAQFSACGDACPATCRNPNGPWCELCYIEGGCACKPGYVKNHRKCILLSDCPTITTSITAPPIPTPVPTTIFPGCVDPNAEVVNCPNPCPGGTCEQSEFSRCPRRYCIYELGCQCKAGYVKDTNGNCILLSQCSLISTSTPQSSTPVSTTVTGCEDPNAELVDCPNPCPGGTCTQPMFLLCMRRICFPLEDRGCQCKTGYVKDSNGKCILLSQCPNTTVSPTTPLTSTPIPISTHPGCVDPNAELVICPNPCPGGTCEQPEFFPCPGPVCINRLGCQCKTGYVKDTNGNCILLSQCPPVLTTTSAYVSEAASASLQIP